MTDSCCAPQPDTPANKPATRGLCPACDQKGKSVDTLTVKAHLALPLDQLGAADYRFCRTASCPTVYYSADGREQWGEEALRERVHQKHPDDPQVQVCYCFRHTPGSIRAELEATGQSSVVETITAGIKAGQCACEVRNPQGSCCLGNVQAVVRKAEAETLPGSAPAGVATGV